MLHNLFFYLAFSGKFHICDTENCSKSERTFDLKLFDIANNEKLLSLLNLYYMQGNYGNKYTYQSRGEWFCGYLASFSSGELSKLQYQKSKTNPLVRLLIEDEPLLSSVRDLIG